MVNKDFLDDHIKHIENTLQVLTSKDLNSELNPHEQAGTATFIMNLYTGIENILRHILEEMQYTKVQRTSTWHKDILSNCVEKGIISSDLSEALMDYMKFRHRHVHGYGYMDDWNLVKPLATGAKSVIETFFAELKANRYL